MVKLSDEQVDFILDEIKANGVTIEDLQYNLLDHICCIIENEMSDNDDFRQFFQKVLPRFFQNNLREIQEETELLLTFKHFYAMKKTVNITGILVIALMLLFSFLKIFHLPGASFILILEVALFSLLFLPLMIALKFKDDGTFIDKIVLSGGLVLGIISAIGILFKLMHWPYATKLMLIGVSGFTFVYVPLYFLTRFRRTDQKFNTVVNSVLMMATGGLLFSLFSLYSYTRLSESNKEVYSFLVQESALEVSPKNDTVSAENKKNAEPNLEILQEIKLHLLAAKLNVSKAEILKMGEENAYELVSNDALFKQHMQPNELAELKKVVADLEQKLAISLQFSSKEIQWENFSLKDGLQQITIIQIRCQRRLN